MEYRHVHTKQIYTNTNTNQSVAIDLMNAAIFDLVRPSMLYILLFANKSILSSEIISDYAVHCLIVESE